MPWCPPNGPEKDAALQDKMLVNHQGYANPMGLCNQKFVVALSCLTTGPQSAKRSIHVFLLPDLGQMKSVTQTPHKPAKVAILVCNLSPISRTQIEAIERA